MILIDTHLSKACRDLNEEFKEDDLHLGGQLDRAKEFYGVSIDGLETTIFNVKGSGVDFIIGVYLEGGFITKHDDPFFSEKYKYFGISKCDN